MAAKGSVLVLLGLVAASSNASIVVYTGGDPGNSTDPRPNSLAAALAFDTAASGFGTVNLIDFESAPVGPFSSLNVGGGVTLSGLSFASNNQEILSAPMSPPDGLFGFNTTSGGTHFVSMNGGTLTFSFATPVQSFGAFFTGVQINIGTVTFNDGSSQTLTLPSPNNGGIEFFGFTDSGQSISSLTINVLGDIIGIDDVRYVKASEVPEPTSMGALGVGGLALMRRRKLR